MGVIFRFDRFFLDADNRQLKRDDEVVELSSRYLDALLLLVREQGMLVSKDRFLDEVWKGVPVTDEALTQCIKTLRRQLGDDAANPRFIETVPKHGYRFIATVEKAVSGSGAENGITAGPLRSGDYSWREFFLIGRAGMIGGGSAGLFGGLLYGFAASSQSLESGMGATSVLLVLVCVTILVGLAGGAGVGFGIAAAGFAARRAWLWHIIGGASGGMIVGALAKLIGLDAFNLLLGQSPGDITGAAEGAVLGGAVGLGVWLGISRPGPSMLGRSMLPAALAGGFAGAIIPLLGGRLMGGSLDLLLRVFPQSRLRLDQISGLFGESGFGTVSQVVTGGIEGMIFGSFVGGAIFIALNRGYVTSRPNYNH